MRNVILNEYLIKNIILMMFVIQKKYTCFLNTIWQFSFPNNNSNTPCVTASLYEQWPLSFYSFFTHIQFFQFGQSINIFRN